MPLSATEARTQLGFSSGMNDTQTATATTTAPLVAWRWQLQRFCGSVLSSPIVSAIRRCCRMVTRAPTSTCVIGACMAVMSRLRRRNASTTLPRGWARHSANWHQRGRSPAQLSVDVGMGNWSRRRSSSSPGTTVRLYVAVPVTWMQCAMLSSPPSSMLRPPMRTLTTHAAPLAATAGVSSSGRWQRERSQVPIATSWARHWQGMSLDMSRRSMCDSATLICCVAAWKAQHRMLMRACTRKCGRSVRRQASSAFSVSWRQHVQRSPSSIRGSSRRWRAHTTPWLWIVASTWGCLLQKRMPAACSSLVGKWWTAQGRHALLVLLHVRMLRKQIMQLELSEQYVYQMHTVSIPHTHTHTLCSVHWYCEPTSEYFLKQLFAISTYMSCVIAHSMIIMSCNSSNLMAFDRRHLE